MKKLMVQVFVIGVMLAPYVLPVLSAACEGGGP